MKLFYCLVVYNFIDTHYFLIRKLFMKNFEIYWTEKDKIMCWNMRNDFNEFKYSIKYIINSTIVTNAGLSIKILPSNNSQSSNWQFKNK